ncbi:TRAP transporter substrate-binding protein [Amorphus sp. 3PC139-8]|uniref:TRAP transporter substrate-binding protein n=1 Tax=Amorphus sp. 3PC139-8 TaxID=2735676 RepID=UPI00345CFE89
MGVAAAATQALAADPIEVKISYNQPETSPGWQEVMKVFGEELAEKSDGRLKPVYYPGEVLHTVADGFRATGTGITDVTSAWPVYQANSFNLFLGTELPLALPTSDIAAVRALNELYPEFFKKEYERLGVKLAFNAATPGYDILTTKPVKSVDDLKGLKIRAAGGGITEIVERLGAVPVTMTISDAYTAFQQGVVDGIILSTADQVAYRLHEVGKYNYRIGVVRVAIPQAVNPKFYDSLPEDLKTVFDEAALNAAYNYQKMYKNLTASALETMKEEGIEVTEATPEDLAKIEKMVAPMYDAFLEKNADRSPSGADLIEAMTALRDKYEGMSDTEILKLKDTDPAEGLR